MSIDRERHTGRSGTIAAALMLLGCLLAQDGRAQATAEENAAQSAAEAEAEAQARALLARMKESFGGKELPQTTPTSPGTSRYLQRRAFREARRQAKLERSGEDASRVAAAASTTVAAPEAATPRVAAPAASTKPSVAGAATPSDIVVSFKLASAPDGWTSKEMFTTPLQDGDTITVEAMVQARDASGKAMEIRPEWKPADPKIVQVSPGEGAAVKITVRGRGESNVTLVGPGFSKDLWISATGQGSALRVQISQ